MIDRGRATWVLPIALGVLAVALLVAVILARQSRASLAHVAAPHVVTPKQQSTAPPPSATLSVQATYGAGLMRVVDSPVPALTPQLGNKWRELGRKVGRLLVSPTGTRSQHFEMSMAVVAPQRAARLEILTSEGQRVITSMGPGPFE